MHDEQTVDATRSVVAAMLAASGVVPPADDLDELAVAMTAIRGRMARLQAVDCGDVAPVIVRFQP